jgi:acyl dehydratase
MSDHTVGTERAPWTDDPLTVTDFVRYQGASGDMNPIHHDPEFARTAGYPGVFSVGMLQAGVMGTYATDWLGPHRLRSFRVRFHHQAWPGDVLTYRGVIVDQRESRGERIVEVELTCARQTGELHLTGRATFTIG